VEQRLGKPFATAIAKLSEDDQVALRAYVVERMDEGDIRALPPSDTDRAAMKVSDRILSDLDAGRELQAADLKELGNEGMQDILDFLDGLNKAGQLDDLANYLMTGTSPRLEIAVATVQKRFDQAWRDTVAKLGDADREALLARPPAGAFGDGGAPPAKKKPDDDSIDTTIEVSPQGVQTNIQITIKLRATDDDHPHKAVILPDIEITLHVGNNASTSTVEAQLNLVKIKQDLSKWLNFNGHVLVQSVEFKMGVSGEAGMTDVALMQIQKSLEVKVKAGLEFTVRKSVSVSIEVDAGQGGVTVIPKLVFHF
jgi:hypothetical protein